MVRDHYLTLDSFPTRIVSRFHLPLRGLQYRSSLHFLLSIYNCWFQGRTLGRNWDRSLKSFPPCYSHCYPFSSELVRNLTLALSWVSMGHMLKLCNKGHIRVLHLTVHELSFGGRNRKRFEQARTYNLLHYNPVLYHCAIFSYTNVQSNM